MSAAPAAAAAASSSSSAAAAAASTSAGTAAVPVPPMEPAPIMALSPAVVNRIAAGEVIHRPASALKELLENAVDARATKVAVQLRDGGLHTLQITDNGCGIRVADYPILCERFTTSKLQEYSDLRDIATFGFRGEALASITHVAHVSITSMVRGAQCAYKASFSDGRMINPLNAADTAVSPKPCAGVQGTVVHVEDLFYNVPIRRTALRNAHSEEYARCLDVLCKYAVHYAGRVSLSCKKIGQNKLDLNTPLNATTVDNIRSIYGASIAKELLPLQLRLDAAACLARGIESSLLHVDGWVSNANYSQKKLQLLLFINHRLVESLSLRRVLDACYARVLPRHTHPFAYLSLMMDPRILDVNVHPTKKEVHFLYEEAIMAAVEDALEAVLKGANKSRVFYTQSISAGAGAGGGMGEAMVAAAAAASSAAPAGMQVAPSSARSGMDVSEDARAESEEKQYAAASSTATAVAAAYAQPSFMELEGDDFVVPSAAAASAAAPAPRLSQASLPSSYRPAAAAAGGGGGVAFSAVRAPSSSFGGLFSPLQSQSQSQSRRDDKLVRTDNRQGKMDMFYSQVSPQQQHPAGMADHHAAAADRGRKRNHDQLDEEEDGFGAEGGATATGGAAAAMAPASAASYPAAKPSRRAARAPVQILLTSVQNLVSEITSRAHPHLQDMLKSHSFVGLVAPNFALVQGGTRLFLLNLTGLSRAFMYETALRRFGHHPILRFGKPVPVRGLIRMAIDHPSQQAQHPRHKLMSPEQREAQADEFTQLLVSRAAMLKEYFALEIVGGEADDAQADADAAGPSDAMLVGIPELLEQYNPPLMVLPLFLLKLARDCNWTSEQECFESVARCIADFYSVQPEHLYLPAASASAAPAGSAAAASNSAAAASGSGGTAASSPLPPLSWWVEHVLLPAMRHRSSFSPPLTAASDGTVTQIASLENLYKIFERC